MRTNYVHRSDRRRPHPVDRNRDRRSFSGSASHTHELNVQRVPERGGHRL